MNNKFEKDIEYWNNYYSLNENAPQKPSSFAIQCLSEIDKTGRLVEFGCGNGRDSLFFANNSINVLAIDRSKKTIEKNITANKSEVDFIQGDFTEVLNEIEIKKIKTVYSRFTLHSVDREGYTMTINAAYNALEVGGVFLIEARTIHDPLFGEGEDQGDNGFFTTHYRRFLTIERVISDLRAIGFDVYHAVEDYLSSWYKEDHAVVLRIFAKKLNTEA